MCETFLATVQDLLYEWVKYIINVCFVHYSFRAERKAIMSIELKIGARERVIGLNAKAWYLSKYTDSGYYRKLHETEAYKIFVTSSRTCVDPYRLEVTNIL